MISRSGALVWLLAAASLTARDAVPRGGFSDNRPFKIFQTSPSSYPPWLASAGVRQGQALAVINIDADGKLADCLVIAYTDPDFAREAVDAARAWEYAPAYERGQPVGTRTELMFNFEAQGMVLSVSPADLVASQMNRIVNPRITSFLAKVSDLDQPLAPINPVKPLHPGKLLQPEQLEGIVRVDFYVDQEGRPRMPVVLRASHELFARAVVDALEQWRFSPPTRAARPVVVRVVQDFVFRPASS
ncbi:MAG: TonB family protein [Opitutaceae bacterium]